MKNFIIVSKCLRVTKINTETGWYEFHFKGVFAGEIIKSVILCSSPLVLMEKGTEYLIYAEPIAVVENVLKGKVIKVKRLEDCWDKS